MEGRAYRVGAIFGITVAIHFLGISLVTAHTSLVSSSESTDDAKNLTAITSVISSVGWVVALVVVICFLLIDVRRMNQRQNK